MRKNHREVAVMGTTNKAFDTVMRKGITMKDYYLSTLPSEFEEAALKHIVMKYLPLNTYQCKYLRAVIKIANNGNTKVKEIGKDSMEGLIQKKAATFRRILKEIFCGNVVSSSNEDRFQIYLAFGFDSWTSKGNQSYLGTYAHWIDKKWRLRSCPLRIAVKKGTSTAEDNVRQVEEIFTEFGLSYKNIIAIVSDTEPTMVAAGRLFEDRARLQGYTEFGWQGCLDHIINLTTKVAFSFDSECMKAARELVQVFKSSSNYTSRSLCRTIRISR